MNQQSSQQQWSLLYYRKKAQFNQYVQFKAKSFQYQKLLGNLNYLVNDDDQSQRKQIKQLLINLNDTMDQMNNLFSEIHEQMKFLKLQNLITLIEGVQQLMTEIHRFTIQNIKRRLQYTHKDKQEDTTMDTCRKCLGSINQLNLKRLYDEITTTESTQDQENTKMTRQERRKMISQLDQYDILLAEKENYLRKVNALLEKKGRVGQLSNHDKTYNFLSQYLSKIEKIQQRRNKSYNKTDPALQQDRKWQQQSYKHILQYIKRVLFEHFVNQCSGPVKKMFQKINIDKLFKSFGDHQHSEYTNQKPSSMQNHQTQTVAIPEMEQLKIVQKKLDFKVKQIAMVKTNKQELQKKYIACLDQNRKLQSEMFQVKKQRKWFQSQMTIAQQNLKRKMTERYQQAVKNYQQDQQRTIQRYINQREKLLRTSKTMEAELAALEEEHKKCQRMRNKAKGCETVETQTIQQQFVEQVTSEKEYDGFLMVDTSSHMKRRKSKINKMVSMPMPGQRRINVTFSKQSDKHLPPMFDTLSQDTIIQQDDYNSSRIKTNTKLSLQSHKLDFTIDPSSCGSENQQQYDHEQMGEEKTNQRKERNSVKKFNRGRSSEQQYGKFSMFQRTLTAGDQIRTYKDIHRNDGNSNNKQMKISINAFKKMQQQPNINNTTQQLQQVAEQGSNQNSPCKMSKLDTNRFTQGCEGSSSMKKNLGYNVTSPQFFASMRKGNKVADNNKNTGYMVSERLYSRRKRKQSKQLPFQRVIENGKQKFYIKKISRQSTNYKFEKQRMKQISQILKPYVYNNHHLGPSPPKSNQSPPRSDLKSIRQRLNWMGHKRFSKNKKTYISLNKSLINNDQYESNQEIKMIDTTNHQLQVKNIGQEVVAVQQIVESEYAYLKAVGFVDFLMKIGKQNKKIVNTINNIEHEVKEKFKSPQQLDLELFGGRKQAENYTKGRSFWMLDEMKDNIMIYNKNDGLSIKVQKYFTLLKRANPELYGILIKFLTDPLFAVFGQKTPKNEVQMHRSDDGNFIRDLFNQLQKYHKIKHNQCTHIIDFLEKIGFYKYTYF